MKQRFLILGCNGMAGHVISCYLAERGYNITGFARKKSLNIETIIGDARDLLYVEKVIREGNYDIIVNCIGILNQFAESNAEEAILLNAYLPHFINRCLRNLPTRLIHISTDCVFSGKQGSYSEDDICDGSKIYDRTKAMGELDDDSNITIRTSIIGPDANIDGIGLFNWFMKKSGCIMGYTNVIWTGLTTLQLAKTIEFVSQNKITGLHNIVPDTSISKYNILKLLNRFFKNEEVEIIPEQEHCSDKSLITQRRIVGLEIPGYEVMLSELHDWMLNHMDYYPNYKGIIR